MERRLQQAGNQGSEGGPPFVAENWRRNAKSKAADVDLL
jgi:hypothetical protein